MAIWYADLANSQLQGNNFPGQTGFSSGISAVPTLQTNSILEGPSEIVATYTWTGSEAANDIINWAIIPAGSNVDPWGHWQNGPVAPATTLTASVGDNDLGLIALGSTTGGLPIPNPQAAITSPTGIQANGWVTGTVYAPGAVVLDPGDTPVNTTWTNWLGLTSATQPHSDAAHWFANSTRYSTAINVAAASAAVAFAPPAVSPGFNPYLTANDCWLQSKLVTLVTPVAGAISVLRVYINANN